MTTSTEYQDARERLMMVDWWQQKDLQQEHILLLLGSKLAQDTSTFLSSLAEEEKPRTGKRGIFLLLAILICHVKVVPSLLFWNGIGCLTIRLAHHWMKAAYMVTTCDSSSTSRRMFPWHQKEHCTNSNNPKKTQKPLAFYQKGRNLSQVDSFDQESSFSWNLHSAQV